MPPTVYRCQICEELALDDPPDCPIEGVPCVIGEIETPEPCTNDANLLGCICFLPLAGPTAIDPPEPRIHRDCILHGADQ